MATAVLNRKQGVIVGDDVLNLFKYAQEKQFAIPAIVFFLLPHLKELTKRIIECNFLFHRSRST